MQSSEDTTGHINTGTVLQWCLAHEEIPFPEENPYVVLGLSVLPYACHHCHQLLVLTTVPGHHLNFGFAPVKGPRLVLRESCHGETHQQTAEFWGVAVQASLTWLPTVCQAVPMACTELHSGLRVTVLMRRKEKISSSSFVLRMNSTSWADDQQIRI